MRAGTLRVATANASAGKQLKQLKSLAQRRKQHVLQQSQLQQLKSQSRTRKQMGRSSEPTHGRLVPSQLLSTVRQSMKSKALHSPLHSQCHDFVLKCRGPKKSAKGKLLAPPLDSGEPPRKYRYLISIVRPQISMGNIDFAGPRGGHINPAVLIK